VVRVIVAGQLARASHNAPLHLFSAAPELVGFGQTAYCQHSAETSLLLGQLFERFREEGFTMTYTMEDFKRDYVKEHFAKLTPQEQREALERLSPEQRREVLQSLPPEERREVLRALPPEELLAALSAEQIREYLDHLTAARPQRSRKSRRKK
jgi:hypothetical protein